VSTGISQAIIVSFEQVPEEILVSGAKKDRRMDQPVSDFEPRRKFVESDKAGMCDLAVLQGPAGRPPNVSPARTLLPHVVWRIALYAVFRKENRTRDPLQRSQGGSKGKGWGINPRR
jgi:hypothetical protein